MVKLWENEVAELEKEYLEKLNNWVSISFIQTREGYEYLAYDEHNQYVYPPSSLPFLGHLKFPRYFFSSSLVQRLGCRLVSFS